jgi:hypothetical protein
MYKDNTRDSVMKNLLSHLIHLTVITEFEVLFYIYYIVPYERASINKMFDYTLPYQVNATILAPLCYGERERLDSYNDKLIAICYYYVGAINALLLGAFIYDVYKVFYKADSIPRVLSSPKSWLPVAESSSEIEMVQLEEPKVNNPLETESFIVKYWNQSRFLAKMGETLQLIILLGIFEYLFFNYLFNRFKIVSAKLIACGLIK